MLSNTSSINLKLANNKQALEKSMGIGGTRPDDFNSEETQEDVNLITRVLVKDPSGEIVAGGIVDSIQCNEGTMTIKTREPLIAGDILAVVHEGAIVVDNAKIPDSLL